MEQYQPFKRKINYYETDKMQVVHHSNYIRYLEECRMDFLKQIDLDYEVMEAKGVMIPVLSVECSYITPAKFGETICIVPKLEKFTGIKFEMSYKIYSADDGVLHNRAHSSHCFVGLDFKPIRIKREHPHIYEVMSSLVGKDWEEIWGDDFINSSAL
ncbi:MAG: acyl-CoA thioesterase [Lachnospiraceae bacterium]|nr:acyl-CoA thioesterase [Lachnospiraceae bacterium]